MAPPATKTVRGEVAREDGDRIPDLWTLELLTQGRPVERVPIMPDGGFEVHGVPVGNYEVRITDAHHDFIHRDHISVNEHSNWISVRLPKLPARARPAGETVSIQRLMRPIPSGAQKEFARAEKALAKNEMAESVRHLEKAIGIFPDYMEAHNNLGVRYMRMGEAARAAEAFGRAVELDPSAAMAQTNLALALINLRRFDEAESVARRAVRLDAASAQARYALGISLASRNICTAESLDSLRRAVSAYPRARLTVATVMACRGDRAGAAAEVETYLADRAAPNREGLERWLRQLRSEGR
jgi:tetratricopeptide (TPR) repeat protein